MEEEAGGTAHVEQPSAWDNTCDGGRDAAPAGHASFALADVVVEDLAGEVLLVVEPLKIFSTRPRRHLHEAAGDASDNGVAVLFEERLAVAAAAQPTGHGTLASSR